MFNTLLQYLLDYGLVLSFGIATMHENIVKVPDTSFYVLEDCIHYFLNDTGVLVRPNGITVYSKSPCLVWKAVFHSSPTAILIRLYPFFMSKLVNHFVPLVLLSSSLMSGRRYLFTIVRWFRALQSTQSLRHQSFLRTNRIVAEAAEQDCQTFYVGIFCCRYFPRASSSFYVGLQMAPVGIFTFGSRRGIW